MEVYTLTKQFLKDSIHSKNVDVKVLLDSMEHIDIDEIIATNLLWTVLTTVNYFYDDFDTIIEEPSIELVSLLVDYCIKKGAKVNSYIHELTIDLEPIYEYYDCQTPFIRIPWISPLLLAMFKKDESLILQMLNHINSCIHMDEVYISFDVIQRDRIRDQTPSMPIVKHLLNHTQKISPENIRSIKSFIINRILDSNDLVGWEYYLKNLFSYEDDLYIPAIILCRSKAISLKLIECFSKEFIQSYVTPHGNTLLHLACRAGHEQLVRVLLKKGLNHHCVNRHGETAMFWACKNGNPYIVYRLLKKNVHHSYETLLGYANRFNRPTVRKVILEFKYGKEWYKRIKINILLKAPIFKGIEPMLVWKMVELANNS